MRILTYGGGLPLAAAQKEKEGAARVGERRHLLVRDMGVVRNND